LKSSGLALKHPETSIPTLTTMSTIEARVILTINYIILKCHRIFNKTITNMTAIGPVELWQKYKMEINCLRMFSSYESFHKIQSFLPLP
jgi:hypothetical protein